MSDAKRPDPKRRSPTSRPGRAGEAKGRPRKTLKPQPSATARDLGARRDPPEAVEPETAPLLAETPESVRQSISAAIAEQAEQQSEQRLGFTARRAAILAAVVCVLTLTIAGPVRTYFAQRTEMQQLAATEASLRSQIADLQQQKEKLGDPVFIAAQARERLGFVMPGDIPYQVQLPPSAALPPTPGGPQQAATASNDPWYTSLWKTIADNPHGAPPVDDTPAVPPPPDPGAPPPDPGAPPPPPPGQPGG
jgi:cell division protein FtsB